MALVIFLLLYIAADLFVASLAKANGRSFIGWFFISFVTTPVLGIILLSITKK